MLLRLLAASLCLPTALADFHCHFRAGNFSGRVRNYFAERHAAYCDGPSPWCYRFHLSDPRGFQGTLSSCSQYFEREDGSFLRENHPLLLAEVESACAGLSHGEERCVGRAGGEMDAHIRVVPMRFCCCKAALCQGRSSDATNPSQVYLLFIILPLIAHWLSCPFS